MGSLSIQPPSGLSRNLTEVFNFLRNNAHHFSHLQVGFSRETNDDRVHLISLDEENGVVSATASSLSYTPPSWVNVLDEINYEFSRIKTRQASLKEIQQKHLGELTFNDECSSPEQERIKELTDELTGMFTHTRRLIRFFEEKESKEQLYRSLIIVRENVVISLSLTLNNLLHTFRVNQSLYLKQLDSRTQNIDAFVLASKNTNSSILNWSDTGASFNETLSFENLNLTKNKVLDNELSITQIQQIMQNEHMSKEREKEVIKISQSILELNILFKDVASLVLDQGTILDRIDYNVERSSFRIKSALKDVQKAQNYQKGNKKMQIILVLAGLALFLMLIILLTKF